MSMKLLVIGCGSIGLRHIANLRALGIESILAFDPDPARVAAAVDRFSVTPRRSLEEGLEGRPEAALICTPPARHIPLATRALAAGCHLFIEKPLSNDLQGVDELLEAARRADRAVCVGYNLRFEEGMVRLKRRVEEEEIGRVLSLRAEYGQYLPDWRPERNYRDTYTAQLSLGGGIVLDGSHEIDYARWLCGEVEGVYCSAGRFSSLEMDVEDIAEISLRMQNRLACQVHLDCVDRAYTRRCRLIGEKGTLEWDVKAGLRRYDAQAKSWSEEPGCPDLNRMFRAEMAHFLACVRGEESPRAGGSDGKRVLQIALAALRSAAERREVTP
jgi:predicted dehydrogenase